MNYIQDAYNVLTNKAYQNIAISGILVGLLINALAIKGEFKYWLLFFYICVLAFTILTDLVIILPKPMGITTANDEIIDKFRYEPNEKIADHIIYAYETEFNKQKPIVMKMAECNKIAYIGLSVQIILTALLVAF